MKTLIIEDERSLAREIKLFLEKAFYLCDNAYNAAEAKKLMMDRIAGSLLTVAIPLYIDLLPITFHEPITAFIRLNI